MKEIFISRPNWISEEHEEGLENFYNLLNTIDLNPRTIGQSDYPNESPLDEVIELMKKCSGTIVLGIPQLEISKGILKGKEVNNILLGTEWNHIEGALARSLNQPLLIIHHNKVKRGIFDRGAINSFMYSVDMSNPSWCMSKEITGAISNWKNKLTDQLKKHHQKDSIKPTLKWGCYKFEGEDGLFCPVCYETKELKIPCSRFSSSVYQCPNCKAKLR